jgi:GT2 family glycosyltransferase
VNVCYVREPKPGLDFARNRALRECETTLLAYIDDDAVVDRFWICGIRRALAENPDAGAITGPVLPWELATEPQILLEQRGGFGRYFRKQRITNSDQPYPYDFGSGCNMVFLRKALIAISGFDEALDNGRILAGDQDALHRIVLAGYALVADPGVLVFHEHRRDYTALRCQMRLWGASTMAMMMKNLVERFGKQSEVLGYIYRRLRYLVHQFVRPAKNRHPAFWPRDLVSAELLGAFAGILGAYGRSRRHADRIRASFSEGTHAQ